MSETNYKGPLRETTGQAGKAGTEPEWKRLLSLALDMLRTAVAVPLTLAERDQCTGFILEAWRIMDAEMLQSIIKQPACVAACVYTLDQHNEWAQNFPHAWPCPKCKALEENAAWRDAERLRSIVKHWREFGPDGLDELIENAAPQVSPLDGKQDPLPAVAAPSIAPEVEARVLQDAIVYLHLRGQHEAALMLKHSRHQLLKEAAEMKKGDGNFVEQMGGEVTPTGRPPEGESPDMDALLMLALQQASEHLQRYGIAHASTEKVLRDALEWIAEHSPLPAVQLYLLNGDLYMPCDCPKDFGKCLRGHERIKFSQCLVRVAVTHSIIELCRKV